MIIVSGLTTVYCIAKTKIFPNKGVWRVFVGGDSVIFSRWCIVYRNHLDIKLIAIERDILD